MSKEPALIRHLLSHPEPDVRLWRNAVGDYWTGQLKGFTADGCAMLAHPSRVSAGLCVGSSDLIGLMGPNGRFIAAEVKTPGVVLEPHQARFLEMIRELGGIAGEVRSEEDLRNLIRGGVVE